MSGISIKGVTKSYNSGATDMAALSRLDLEIEPNTFVTLLGPSGCGKTTTLRLIAGYLTPDTGTIHANGRLLSSKQQVLSPENRGMGMVFQNYAVWPHKTVFENVVFGLKLRGVSKADAHARVTEALGLVNLTGLEARFPNELSGGQQQRVALARSLVVEPDILLLDEPLSNLDAKLRERMRTELKQLQRRTGITFVYVTHDQAEALALSDKIAVMHAGKLQQFGTPYEVYATPANRTVADFMGLVNILHGRVLDGGRVSAAGMPDWKAKLPDWARSGQEIDIAVRPENVHMTAAGSGSGIAGTVTEHTYIGNLAEYAVEIPSKEIVRVQTHPMQRFEVGDQVSVSFETESISYFEKTASETAVAGAA